MDTVGDSTYMTFVTMFAARQVLILAPFRSRAAAVVRRLWALAQAETRVDSVQHRDRFLDDFGGDSGDESDGEDGAAGAGAY